MVMTAKYRAIHRWGNGEDDKYKRPVINSKLRNLFEAIFPSLTDEPDKWIKRCKKSLRENGYKWKKRQESLDFRRENSGIE